LGLHETSDRKAAPTNGGHLGYPDTLKENFGTRYFAGLVLVHKNNHERALASHKRGLCSIPARCHMLGQFVVGSRLAPRVEVAFSLNINFIILNHAEFC